MRKVCVQSPALILVLVLLAAVPAFSTVTTFNDRATWESALLGRQDVDFNAFNPNPWIQPSLTVGNTPDTVYFTPISGYLSAFMSAWDSACAGNCLRNYTDTATATRGISAVFAQATISALAFNLFTADNAGQQVTVRIYEGASVTPTYSEVVSTNGMNTPAAFFGFTSDATIAKIEFVTSNTAGVNGQVVIDNFSWGEAISAPPNPGGGGAETPESATLGYVGAGIIALALSARRKRARRIR
jgi:hypothetical protein